MTAFSFHANGCYSHRFCTWHPGQDGGSEGWKQSAVKTACQVHSNGYTGATPQASPLRKQLITKAAHSFGYGSQAYLLANLLGMPNCLSGNTYYSLCQWGGNIFLALSTADRTHIICTEIFASVKSTEGGRKHPNVV